MSVRDRLIGNEIYNQAGLKEYFSEIRSDAESAGSRSDLTQLYWLSGYLVKLMETHAAEEKSGDDVDKMLAVAEEEFCRTARVINNRAKAVGTDANYAEKWSD